MHISFRIGWLFDQITEVDQGLLPLLQAIRHDGSLKKAAQTAGLSYRHAWGMLKRWEQQFKNPLVILERGRGRGTHLTDLGQKLLWAEQFLNERLNEPLQTAADEINGALAEFIHPGHPGRLRICASHDFAIADLYELLRQDPRFQTELQTQGSLESLRRLNHGGCHIAGFHFPRHPIRRSLYNAYSQWLAPGSQQLLQVAIRSQGLIVQPGNPKKIFSIKDLTRHPIRFINRQRGSGTRTILDQLVMDEGIDVDSINGYRREEFTHAAVAAMVLSDAADAGLGLEASAAQFNLDFMPLLEEIYVLAIHPELNTQIVTGLKQLLQSGDFRNRINKLPGYDAGHAGEAISVTDLLSGD